MSTEHSVTEVRKVVIVHGLFMREVVMWPLAMRIARAGFDPVFYNYNSTKRSLAENAKSFSAWLASRSEPHHIVAHSLGGLVALDGLSLSPALHPARFVALASPFNGSVVGRKISEIGGFSWMMGASCVAWEPNARVAPAGWEVAAIRGTKSLGVGRLFTRFSGENDGTVAGDECGVVGAKVSATSPTTHTGIIFSPSAAQMVVSFLKTGTVNLGSNLDSP